MKDKLRGLHQQARLKREATAVEAYGAALATIQENETRENAEFDEAKVLQLLEKEAGKFKESSEAYAKAGREEQAAHMKTCSELI